jgi:hypothetical protein
VDGSERVPVGGLEASRLCLGMAGRADVVHAAFDAGVNFFFVTADMHWPLYEPLRRGLAALLERPGVRDEIVVAGVSYATQPEFCHEPFRELIEAVPGLGRLDVVVAGGIRGDEQPGRSEVFARHRSFGAFGCRAMGGSFHDRQKAAAAVGAGTLDLAFVRYNPAHPGARRDLFPAVPTERTTRLFNFTTTTGHVRAPRARELGVGTDHWQPDITDCYRFAVSRPELDGILAAPRTPAELAGVLDALAAGPLSPGEQDHMMALAHLDRRARA